MNIQDMVVTLLPIGTAGRYLTLLNDEPALNVATAEKSWRACPAWPPDVFAVAATIIERSSCYIFAGPDFDAIQQHNDYLNVIADLAARWTDLSAVPAPIEALWNELFTQYGNVAVQDISERPEVHQVLFKLFAIADEACKGMGWTAPLPMAEASGDASGAASTPVLPAAGTPEVTIADLARSSLLLRGGASSSKQDTMILPNVPFSLCSLVPSDTAIVLPKSMTPTVGCTVRSLSHHLALLPGQTQVLPSWRMVDRDYIGGEDDVEQLRLLVVPYPFHIPEQSFTLSREPRALCDGMVTAGYFGLEQKWLVDDAGNALTAENFVVELLLPLIRNARKEARGKIHGILMPECALSAELAAEVADRLTECDIELFITGALKKDNSGKVKNVALTYIVTGKNGEKGEKGVVHGEQSKHHRWRLDQTQVKRYALSFPGDAKLPVKDRAKQWWEDIDISQRKLPFYALRPDMSLTVLICEDMARNDPAMSVIRAVGPNLVVALLMDGPQLAVRWPARYATVLADDPGSSVLSITCAAMVDRSNWTESRPVRSIGLWRDSGGNTQELNLPQGCYGMLLSLKAVEMTQYTLDNRSDKNSTRKLLLEAAIPLTLDRAVSWV